MNIVPKNEVSEAIKSTVLAGSAYTLGSFSAVILSSVNNQSGKKILSNIKNPQNLKTLAIIAPVSFLGAALFDGRKAYKETKINNYIHRITSQRNDNSPGSLNF